MTTKSKRIRSIIITALITFVATSALWLLVLSPTQAVPASADMPSTSAFGEMEASSNVTVYDAGGEWVGNGFLVETARETILQMGNERYTLRPSDVEGYRYRFAEEKLYVK